MQRLAALPPVVRQQVEPQLVALPQQEPARLVLAPPAPGLLVPVWARVRSVQVPQQVLVLAPPAQACWVRARAGLLQPAPGQRPPTPRWRHMALAQRRAWVAACWAPVVPQHRAP